MWLEREEGDLDLRRERRGGLGGGGRGGDGAMGGLEVVLLLGILKSPPPLSLPLPLCLSLPEKEEAAFKRQMDRGRDGGEMAKHSMPLQTPHMQETLRGNSKCHEFLEKSVQQREGERDRESWEAIGNKVNVTDIPMLAVGYDIMGKMVRWQILCVHLCECKDPDFNAGCCHLLATRRRDTRSHLLKVELNLMSRTLCLAPVSKKRISKDKHGKFKNLLLSLSGFILQEKQAAVVQ